jgi:hypothetical protein
MMLLSPARRWRLTATGVAGGELDAVALPELGKPIRDVPVPLPQWRRRGDLPAPLVEIGKRLLMPRGHNRSTSTRYPSRAVGAS